MKFFTVEIEWEWFPFGLGLIVSKRELHLLALGLHVRVTFDLRRKGP